MDPDLFRARRARVLDAMAAAGGGLAVLPTAPEALRSRDTEYPYRHDSGFYYLTGFTEPVATLVLVADGARCESVLFCRERDAAHEIWDGPRLGPEGAQATLGFDAAYPVGELDARVLDWLGNAATVFYPLAADAALDDSMRGWMRGARARVRNGARVPAVAHDLAALIDEMRLVKDAGELAVMRRAGAISAQAHLRALRACRPGLREFELEAELLYAFRRSGAQAPAYTSIVAGGANACVLHYAAGDTVLADGALCLIDAGCELDGYAADITRTFPVNGRFGAEQRAVYDIVLAAQHAAFDAIRAGRRFDDPHDAARRVLVQGMLDLGLLSGSVDGAIESKAYRQFYMHRTSHWLGLDVHDVGDVHDPAAVRDAEGRRASRLLQPGMVLTVEPGMYLRPAPNVPAAFEHIGVRIEDDVVVGTGAPEVLSAEVPTAPDELEAVMGAR